MRKRIITVLVASSTVAACGEEAGTSDSEYDELARTVAAGLASPDSGGASGAFFDAAMLARGGTPVGFTGEGLVRGEHDGLTYFYLLYCRDAQGAPLEYCGLRSASATVFVTWQGARTMPSFDGSTRHDAMVSFGELGQPVATISGAITASGTATFPRLDGSQTYTLVEEDRFTLQIDMGSYRVIGGTLDIDLTAKPHEDRTLELQGVVTFARGGTASLVFDGERSYTLDLMTGDVQTPIILR